MNGGSNRWVLISSERAEIFFVNVITAFDAIQDSYSFSPTFDHVTYHEYSVDEIDSNTRSTPSSERPN